MKWHSRIAATALTLSGVAACQHPMPNGRIAVASSAESMAIDSIAQSWFALDMAPGMSVVVVRGDEVVYLRGFGFADREAQRPVTPETMFYIASNTKAFTALAATILDEEGRFDLDAPLSRYLPDVRLASGLSADSISIRSLLTHSHGIGHSGPVVWRTAFTGQFANNDELIRLLPEQGVAPGGRAYRYGNIGYNVASFALDRAMQRSWKDLLAEKIFRPLGLTNTTAYVSRVRPDQLAVTYMANGNGFDRIPYTKTDDNMQAAGGMVSSARDMGRWLEAQLNGGRVDGRQIFSRSAIAETQRMQVTTSQEARGMQQIGYSLGWQIALRGSDTMYVHGGGFSGFSSHVSFHPKSRIGVGVFTNDNNTGSPLVDMVAAGIYQRLLGGSLPVGASLTEMSGRLAQARQGMIADRARRAARSQVLPLPLDRYTGVFVNPVWGSIEVSIVNGRLYSRSGALQAPVEVFDAEKNQLRFALEGGTVVPLEVVDGRVVALTFMGMKYTRQ